MSQLGNLGSRLLQAAKSSDSHLADVITTKQESIEKERPLRLQKDSKPSKTVQGSRKPQTWRKKKTVEKHGASQERQTS